MSKQFKLFIDGHYVSCSAGTFERYNPANNVHIGTFHQASKNDVVAAIGAARKSFDSGIWPQIDTQDRPSVMLPFADLLLQHKEELGQLESGSLGSPDSIGPSFVEYGAKIFCYFAGLARDINGQSLAFNQQQMVLVIRKPIGVATLILPWNFPLGELVWKLAPAIAAGCSVVVKPDSKPQPLQLRSALC